MQYRLVERWRLVNLCFLLSLLLGPTAILAQEFHVSQAGDTLTISAYGLTSDPFKFGASPIEHLMKLHPTTVRTKRVENVHVSNKVDTIFTLSFPSASFDVYKVESDMEIICGALVTSTRFETSQGIRVGQTKSEVQKLLAGYKVSRIPRFLVLGEFDAVQYLLIEFRNDRVLSIFFSGYID